MLGEVLKDFDIQINDVKVVVLNQGLINSSWKIEAKNESYVLQKINDKIFKNPNDIAVNIDNVATYLKENHPHYLFPSTIKNKEGFTLVYKPDSGYYRIFPYIAGSHSKDVVVNAAQAYEAATQFGRFTKLLAGFNASQLKITLPHFHNLTLRFQQFEQALVNGNQKRIKEASSLIAELKDYATIKDEYEAIKNNPEFKLRVTHHDTKISNVLFDSKDNGLCVIDLDTMMPGYFFSDAGDMMRTYLSPVSEEETDISKIEIREDFYEAVVHGYYNEMKDVLTATEKEYFFFAGTFMIYMQALRFITDYFNDDVYYGVKYPNHNLNRAVNQATLLKRLYEKKEKLENVIHVFR